MSDSEKVSVETLPLTKAFMQDLYDKFDAAYAAYNTYRTVVDGDGTMTFKQHPTDPNYVLLDADRFSLPKSWVGLTKETMNFIIAKHTHLVHLHYDSGTKTSIINENVEAEQLVREVEAWLKEKNS